jgi:DNA repair exonuclease SbcCD nuclease subunit
MKFPYLLLADLHCHDWSWGSKSGPDGVNSRLRVIIDELERAAGELRAAGGDTIVIAGDLFHTRGSIDPEVFNPVFEAMERLLKSGIKIVAIPGNHDLKGKETTELGNSFQSLGRLQGFRIATVPMAYFHVALIPWQSSTAKLHEAIESYTCDCPGRANMDLIIHAGIDGVLSHMPDHGLKAEALAEYGFRRVFAGHYHHHKDFGNGVYSIGASSHQTWSDVGTKAGFCLVYKDRVEWRASHAPEFIDITPDTDPDDYPLIIPGNYVRVRGFKLSNEELKLMRDELEALGAKGVSFQVARETPTVRATGRAAPAMSLEASLAKFIKDTIEDERLAFMVQESCNDILSVVTSAA